MLVPWRVVAVKARAGDFDESHAGLDKTSRAERLGRVKPLVFILRIHTVKFADVRRFAGNVGNFGNRALHA